MPGAGRDESKLAAQLRSFAVGKYLIFYPPIEDGVALVPVLRGARDISPE
jgi:toxin ParE1/3/4